MFRQPRYTGLDGFIVALRTTPGPRRRVRPVDRRCPYQTVARPTGALMSAADWTFADLAEGWGSFAKSSRHSRPSLT